MPTAFISYSHDTPAHAQRVLAVADRLRDEGVDVKLDQYEANPSEGWPLWSQRQIVQCDFTVLVCTPTYKRRFNREETPGVGLGATWEAMIAERLLYESGGYNEKFLPVLFEENTEHDIPLSLRNFTYYRLRGGYDDLYRRLTGQAKTPPRPLGNLRRMAPAPRPSFPKSTGVHRSEAANSGPEDQPLVDALQSWEVPSPAPAQPAKLLEARYQVVDFEGREHELALLDGFTSTAGRDGALVIVGPGGAGKTRLMIEWCERLRQQHWLAGFLKRDLPKDLGPLAQGDRARLVVIDYAETNPAVAAAVLRAMVHRKEGPPMRVVMLARDKGPWLRHIRQDDSAVEDCLDAHGVHPLGPLYGSSAKRDRGLAMARERFSALRPGGDASAPPAEGEPSPSAFPEHLEHRALYVHMQALLEAYGDEDAQAGRLSPAQVLDRVLQRERGFWRRSLQRHGATLSDRLMLGAEHAAAALVVCGTVEGHGAAQTLFEAAVTADLGSAERRALVDCLTELYGTASDTGRSEVAPIEPDLLGETLLAGVLERASSRAEGLDSWLDLPFGPAAPDQAMGRALTVLTRLTSRSIGLPWLERLLARRGPELVERIYDTANLGQAEPPGSVLEQALSYLRDGEVAERIGEAVPHETVELREVAATAYSLAVEHGRANDYETQRLSRLLVCLGNALSKVGRREEALTVTLEAVEIRRGLAADRPDAFLPDLAKSLNNLGVLFEGLGRREEALAVTLEAVEIRRGLAADRPDAFLPALAMSLNNLGIWFESSGRREEALTVTLEAVELRRGLAADRPDAFLPDLAKSLNNLGVRFEGLGRREEALTVTLEAVEIRRGLAADRPDAFLPDLASSLNNLGAFFNGLGRREEALSGTLEAVETYRGLAADRPDAFLPNLATSLNNLGMMLSGLARRGEALTVTLEAVETYRGLAADRPDAFLPDLANSLDTLGSIHLMAGLHPQALAAFSEGYRILRPFFDKLPDAFRDLVDGLGRDLRRTCQQGNLPLPDDLAHLLGQDHE